MKNAEKKIEKDKVPPPPDQPKPQKIEEPDPPKEKSAYFQGTDRTQTDSDLASEEDE